MRDMLIRVLKRGLRGLLYTLAAAWLSRHGITLPAAATGGIDPTVATTAVGSGLMLSADKLVRDWIAARFGK